MAGQKSILIVSCSAHGVSALLARELAKRNHLIFVAAPDTPKISKDISDLAAVHIIELDLKSPASASKAAKTVATFTEESGIQGLDVLINDAGVGNSLALLDVMMDAARDIYNAKVSETLSMTNAFADLLAKRRGRVVNLSSSGTFITAPCMSQLAVLMPSASG